MRPKLLKLTALLLVVAGVFAACKKAETDPKEPEPTYPVVISYEEYIS